MPGDDVDFVALTDRPEELRRALDEHGVFTFVPYPSGMFPASDLPPEDRASTGMGMAWFRDNAHVADALLEDGRADEAAAVGRAVLEVLRANRGVLGQGEVRLPVRVDGATLANDTENRSQNDSTGYALWLVCRLARSGHLEVGRADLEVLAEVVGYLRRIEFWRDADEGHWEEDRRVQASSIGTVVAGLRAARELFVDRGHDPGVNIDDLERIGVDALSSILAAGRTDDVGDDREGGADSEIPAAITPGVGVREFFRSFGRDGRPYDASLLFLVEPLRVLPDEAAARVVAGIEQHLVRDHGVARYLGDTYWEPRFPDILGVGERTSAAEGRIEDRNLMGSGVAYTGTEAQWTLFDPVLSVYWGRIYESGGNELHHELQIHYLRRSLSQLVDIEAERQKRKGLPEAYYLEFDGETNHWVKNDHTPLLWSQANLLRAVNLLVRTS
ncbi:glycoside hydrolase family 15 protein [Actinomycetospora sp. C-140]